MIEHSKSADELMDRKTQKENRSKRYLFFVIGFVIFFFLLLIAIGFFYFLSDKTKTHSATYVDNKLCMQCHQAEAKTWNTSHHALAMAHANATSIKANFDNTRFKRHGLTSHFFKRDNKFYIRTDGPTGQFSDYEVKYTFGTDPIQQYIIELPNGRLQNFTLAWDVHHKKWFDLYPNEKTPTGDILHWAGQYQNANMMCVSCHTTAFQKNYNATSDSYTSTWSEMNVSCQSCHGPGEHHVDWAKAQVKGTTQVDFKNEHQGLIDFKRGGANLVIETCAACHSRRSELTANPYAGQPFMNHYLPALLTEGLYYADGQQDAEVYVYNSYRQSKMFQRGVSCVDCHNPHSGKLKFEGNAVCTQCHSPQGDKRFPTAAKRYDDPLHTFHKTGSPGAQCVNCHMPAKKYMLIHSRPDHSIRIPRPDLSIKLGTPNACTDCHTNKSAKWAEDWITQWYGANRHSKIHYGEIIAAGRSGNSAAEEALIKLAEDSSEPSVVRATALDLLANYSLNSMQASISGLKSPHPEIRHAAISSLEKIPPAERLGELTPLLSDPIRAVRIEAARALSSTPAHLFDEKSRKAFNTALSEYITVQLINLDMPASSLNLAVLNENLRDSDQAEKYYLNALHIDPDFTPARLNLAQLYSRLNRNADAEKILQEGVHRLPTQGELQYSLGLLLAEEKRLDEAVNTLKQAAKFLPNRARVQYNYALALQQTGQRKKAEQILLTAHQIEKNNTDIIYALVVYYSQENNKKQLSIWTNILEKINPTFNSRND